MWYDFFGLNILILIYHVLKIVQKLIDMFLHHIILFIHLL